MRLPIFDLIDETLQLLQSREVWYSEAAYELQAFFFALLESQCDCLLGIQTRVKSSASLREKILRKNLYKRAQTPDGILSILSDLVGLRMECRFLVEERQLHQLLEAIFSQLDEQSGLYHAPQSPGVQLDLRSVQPQYQNNGFPIYRIDGVYYKDEQPIRFELQIKAMVHLFWDEVEHQIIYKNNSYLLMDRFVKDMLFSTYENLQLVDHQLYTIFQQIEGDSAPDHFIVQEDTMRSLLAKTISDLFFRKMHLSLGFTLNFKHCSDILSHYILSRISPAELNMTTSTRLFNRIRNIATVDMDFEAPLVLEAPFSSSDPFCNKLGTYLVQRINQDYEWNVFFRMLFALEPGNNLQDFSHFLHMIRDRFIASIPVQALSVVWPDERISQYAERLMNAIADALIEDGGICIIYEINLNTICQRIEELSQALSEDASLQVDWDTFRDDLLGALQK